MKLLVVDTYENEIHVFEYPDGIDQTPEAVEDFVNAETSIHTPFGDCHWQLAIGFEIKIHTAWSIKDAEST